MGALDFDPVGLGEQAVRRDHVRFEVDDRMHGDRVHGIARRRGETAMEVEIELARIAAARDDREALVERGVQLLHVEVARALGGEPRDFRLDDEPRLGELDGRQVSEAKERLKVARDDARVHRAHEVPTQRALSHFEQAAILERAQRFAHGDTTRAEAAAELALGRKFVAVLETAIVDGALDVRDDVVVHARCASGLKHGATVRPKEREVKHVEVHNFHCISSRG